MTTLELALLGVILGGALLAFWRERGLRDALLDLGDHAQLLAQGKLPGALPTDEKGVIGTTFSAFDALARSVADRERLLLRGGLEALQLVSRTVDEREEFTRGRFKRVHAHAVALATEAGFPADEVRRIGDAASLIDLGKIAIPDHLLKKPGVLDAEERTILETHSAIGECIVRRMPGLESLLPGILHHHERWDGTGYPGKLAGEKIPRMARVLAIADSYDAMTSERPHRPGFPPGVALDLIERAAGRQFDPALAALFVQKQRLTHAPKEIKALEELAPLRIAA